MLTVLPAQQHTAKQTPARPVQTSLHDAEQSREASPFLELQRTVGNQAVLRLLRAQSDGAQVSPRTTATARPAQNFSPVPLRNKAPLKAQAKLKVNTPGDIYEQEADEVAERVMRMASPPSPPADGEDTQPQGQQLQRACQCAGSTEGAGHCAECERREEGERLQRQTDKCEAHASAPSFAAHTLGSSGQPLDPPTRAFMESRFGHRFGDVRVHTGVSAERRARSVNARASTVGRDIVFGAGQYRPETDSGKRLLAHELTHILQQRAGLTNSAVQKARSDESAKPSYTVDETISAINLALSAASAALENPNLEPQRREKISRQVEKLQSVLPQLEQTRETDGEGVTLDFDTAPAANEINPGDSEKSLDELFGGTAWSRAGEADLAPGEGTPDTMQASALPGGLRVTPLHAPAVQRCAPVCIVVVVVAGLLVAGCQPSAPARRTTPCTPGEVTTITNHRTTAQGWVNQAIDKLTAYRENRDTPEVHAMIANALNLNFHTTDAAHVATIAQRLADVKRQMDTMPIAKFVCTCDPATSDAFTYGTGTNAEIHLCPQWFSSTDSIRRHTTIIHEVGHGAGLSSSGGARDVYEFYPTFRTMPVDTALQNPDSYAIFVRQLLHNGGHPPGTHR